MNLAALLPAATQTTGQPLPLKNLQLPEAIEWWPLAPGWWLLSAFSLTLLVIIVAVSQRKWRRAQDKREARDLLKSAYRSWQTDQNSQQFILQLNTIMKRYCRSRFPQAISLSGSQWIDFLNSSAGTVLFTGNESEALQSGAYRSTLDSEIDSALLFNRCQLWIKKATTKNLREDR